jgi:hypothetical protein
VTRVEKEPKELRENRQRPAENVQNGASGVVCAMEKASNVL